MMNLRGLRTAVLMALASISVAPVTVARAESFSAEQTTEMRGIIKSYLLEHPEIIRDAVAALDEKEKFAEADSRKKALAELGDAIYTSPDGFVIGNPEGKVTLVEFFDYNCGYCKHALDDLDRLMKDNRDLRVILRDFPILSPNSVQAAIVASAAHDQFPAEKYWDYHRKLLLTKGQVGKDQAVDVARGMGADMDRLAKTAAKPEIRAGIQGSDDIAKSLALNGTPSYILGDDVLIGAVGFNELNAKIGNVRKCGKVLCS